MWRSIFLEGLMDSTMVIPPARRVCDSVLVAVEDLSRRRFELSDEEVLFAGFLLLSNLASRHSQLRCDISASWQTLGLL